MEMERKEKNIRKRASRTESKTTFNEVFSRGKVKKGITTIIITSSLLWSG